MFSAIFSRMAPTALASSPPVALQDTTSLRLTFSRLMVFGPAADFMSATYEIGTFFPSPVSMVRSEILSMLERASSLTFNVRSKERLPS